MAKARFTIHPKSSRHRFASRKVTFEGPNGVEAFDSPWEFEVYNQLVMVHGEQNVIRQVSLQVDSGRIRPDFMVVHERYDDDTYLVSFVDAKGQETEAWKLRAAQLLKRFGLKIQLRMKKRSRRKG